MQPASSTKREAKPLPISQPVVAQFPSKNLVIGGGVAIFHVKSGRVVVCYHSRDGYYFLPKGRRDVNETTEQGAEREGYEESGYRNRLLPIVLTHRQPQPRVLPDPRISRLSTEPVWTMFMPQTAHSQYLLFWYVSETLPPHLEEQLDKAAEDAAAESMNLFGGPGVYQYPPRHEISLTLAERFAQEPQGYEPIRHEGTSADEEEMLYTSELVDVETAVQRLGVDTVMADVVRKGWEGIKARMEDEGISYK